MFCAEVLEHISDVERACREIARVARQEIVIGVAYRQDTGVAAPLARNVGDGNPPSAHVNTFDERRLINLFPQLELKAKSFVGSAKSATNPVSIGLMAWPGNPWGTYEQEGPCIYCGAKLVAPVHRRSTLSRIGSGLAIRMNMARSFTSARWRL